MMRRIEFFCGRLKLDRGSGGRSLPEAKAFYSDVNKDLGFKAKAKDLGFKAKTKAKDLSFKAKAKAKDLRFKAKDKDLTRVLESRPRT